MLNEKDIIAINSFNTLEHVYLEVVKANGEPHLRSVQKNWFGRLYMKSGFSSASLPKIAKYIESIEWFLDDYKSLFHPFSKSKALLWDNLKGLSEKFNKYKDNRVSKSVKKADSAADKIQEFVRWRFDVMSSGYSDTPRGSSGCSSEFSIP